jgi:hypothetical protein
LTGIPGERESACVHLAAERRQPQIDRLILQKARRVTAFTEIMIIAYMLTVPSKPHDSESWVKVKQGRVVDRGVDMIVVAARHMHIEASKLRIARSFPKQRGATRQLVAFLDDFYFGNELEKFIHRLVAHGPRQTPL